MKRGRWLLGAAGAALALAACGGSVVVDPSPTGAGGVPSGTGGASNVIAASSTSTSASSATGGNPCPPGTCTTPGSTACQPPSGPKGNACCKCGADGTCAAVCDCAAPDTPIATPTGEQSIASLRPGDLVYSVDGTRIVAVPILAIHRNAVRADHRVVRVRLAGGAILEISGGHPTLDGRTFSELRRGGRLGGVEIVAVDMVPYGYDRTYDILAGSDSGGYFAGGALIGSTLAPAARVAP